MHLWRIYFFNIKFCEIFQGFIKKIPGLFQGFQGFPGLQKFSRVFQNFQGPYEPCTDSLTVVLRPKIEQISGKAYSQTPLGTLANYMYTNNKAR